MAALGNRLEVAPGRIGRRRRAQKEDECPSQSS
jgi:hypothetical protein